MKSKLKFLVALGMTFTLLACSTPNVTPKEGEPGKIVDPTPDKDPDPVIVEHTVTFNYNGGTKGANDPDTVKVSDGSTITTLPTPTKDGYVFEGWYTNSGKEIDASYAVKLDITVNAKYSELAPDVPYTPKDKNLRQRDYTIFNSAPEIRFVADDQSNLNWATQPRRESEKPKVSGKVSTTNCGTDYTLTDLKATMKVRGNYTSNYTKKPFQIAFDKKQNLFGLNGGQKFKKWVLLADVKDTSMLRNALALYLAGNMMYDNVFVSDFTPVHLYLNNQYWGLYLLVEQKEVKTGRVTITEPPEPAEETDPLYAGTDIGYFFELDNYYSEEAAKGEDGDPTFTVEYKPAEIKMVAKGENSAQQQKAPQKGYTVSSDITNRTTQLPFIKKVVEDTYTVLYNASYLNKLTEIVNGNIVTSRETDPEKCLEKVIDIDSFVNMYILHEIACNLDVGYSSFYFEYDAGAEGEKILKMTNPWDFDSTFGSLKDIVEDGNGMYAAESSNFWFTMMCRMEFFSNKVKAKWKAMQDANLFTKAKAMLDDYSTKYTSDYAKNFQKWTTHLNSNPEISFELRNDTKSFANEGAAKTFLSDWFDKRITYLNGVFAANGKGTIPAGLQPVFDKTRATKTRYEAENATFTASGVSVKEKANEGISGNKYISGLDGGAGKVLTFTVNSPKACEGYLVAGLSARTSRSYKFSDLFSVKVGETNVDLSGCGTIAKGQGTDYHCWTYVDVGRINLAEGSNTIVLTTKSTCTNLDYLDLYIPN